MASDYASDNDKELASLMTGHYDPRNGSLTCEDDRRFINFLCYVGLECKDITPLVPSDLKR